MKKIVILLLISLSLNAYSIESSDATLSVQNKTMYVNKEKVKTTKDAEGYADALRIIDEMKGDGWSYDGLCKNKDGSFTLFFSKDGKKSLTTPTIIDIDGAIAIPDGTYIGSLGKTTFENTYKDNKLVKRVVNGKEVDLQTWK